MGAEIVRLKGLKPAPAPSVDFGPLRAEVKNAQDGLVSSMTKISTSTRSFAKALLTRVTGLEGEMQRLRKGGKEKDNHDFGALLAEASGSSDKAHPAVDLTRILALEKMLKGMIIANESLE
jgi:hypothetical protein